MTIRLFLNSFLLSSLVFATFGMASGVRAEGGEGPSIVMPNAAVVHTGDEADEPETTASLPAVEEKTAPAPRSLLSDTVRAKALRPLITQYALQHGVPVALADAVIRVESRYNASARNGPNLGLTQVNFRTAQSLGYTGDPSGLFDAETNLRFGLKYLAQAYKLAGGDLCGAILRYQAGHRAVTMTGAARSYCARVKTIISTSE